MQPLAGAPGYALQLGAANGRELDVHVSLVSDSDAYDAHLSDVKISGAPNDLESDAKIVTLPNGQTVNYFFVDSYAIDGGASVVCPSYVFPMGNDPTPFRIDSGATVATHIQSLGKLACGQIYRSPDLHGDLQFPIGGYGGRPVSTTFQVYIDSNGHAISEKMMQSSGVAGVDSYALGAIQLHQFLPARFLCTPVVGEMLVQLRYIP
jgi:hypothetical protein